MLTSIYKSLILTGLLSVVTAHAGHDHHHEVGQIPLSSGPNEMPVIFNRPVLEKDPYIPAFSGISTFAHLPYLQCWEESTNEDYDIAVIGAPYDIGVTFRTGARFGPSGIREGSKRIKVSYIHGSISYKERNQNCIDLHMLKNRVTIMNFISILLNLGLKQ
jgi:agmatinase